jgi:hypothetical protein
MSDHAKKAGVLLLIARQLRQQANDGFEWLELLMRSGDVARTIQDSSQQAELLRDLGIALTEAQQWDQATRV